MTPAVVTIQTSPRKERRRTNRLRGITFHVLRVGLFAIIILVIHQIHQQRLQESARRPVTDIQIADVASLFPSATSMDYGSGSSKVEYQVFDRINICLGTVQQTAPSSDTIVGFSGSTNTLIGLDLEDRIVGIKVLSSEDTPEHINQVLSDEAFLNAIRGLRRRNVESIAAVDAVSGATLSSRAIQEGIIGRLTGQQQSLRFPDSIEVNDVRLMFPSAVSVVRDDAIPSVWNAKDNEGLAVGSILRSSPSADQVIGYQGPSETLIFFDDGAMILGVAIRNSFDNEPYVSYVREDKHFLDCFNGQTLAEMADADLEQMGVEGVSGATMTSMAISEGMVASAKDYRQSILSAESKAKFVWNDWTARDYGTGAVICAGLAIGLTWLRGIKRLRVAFQVILIVYLGLINGDLLSQAMIAGWAKTGVPWSRAGGLALLTLAAFLVPILSGRNVYCTHLCPHGAAQMLIRNRLDWHLRIPTSVSRWLKAIPALLLGWCLIVTAGDLPFSLVNVEPFDAWVFRIAGWATISIAIVGLVASLFSPIVYCRYACPTGTLLNFLRYNGSSDQWSRRDWLATATTTLAIAWWTTC